MQYSPSSLKYILVLFFIHYKFLCYFYTLAADISSWATEYQLEGFNGSNPFDCANLSKKFFLFSFDFQYPSKYMIRYFEMNLNYFKVHTDGIPEFR